MCIDQGGAQRNSVENIAAAIIIKGDVLQVPCSSFQKVDKARVKTKEVLQGVFMVSGPQ